MPATLSTLTLDDAKRMLDAGESRAREFGIPYNLAVVDAGGHLLGFIRQDGAKTGCVDLAINKAYTARIFDNPTHILGTLAQPEQELFGIEQSNAGRVVILGGGLPVHHHGTIIGAVGTSAGSVEQDIQIAQTMLAAL
ncbi:GlcG/HbpS family heme-binding protein [Thalassospira marina]|uniref:Cobalamin adenosyltransferase n=1 Tax=Thalassospira marina TaxID=2048283 RepID=A0ABN5FGC4_9PROT|nr:heme-binding protein [Thalassospira marina]AUG53523.1 cobalamin adenosyltransferase [Thalassospira marina]